MAITCWYVAVSIIFLAAVAASKELELGSSRVVFQYAIFGKVTKGYEALAKLEELPTRKEGGIFVMPLERITILSTYYYDSTSSVSDVKCEEEVTLLKKRLIQSADNQGTFQGLMLGVPLGCAIVMGIAWQRGWWHGALKEKS